MTRSAPSSPRSRSGTGIGVHLAALVLAGLLAAACRGDAPPEDVAVQVRISTAPTPPIVGPVRIVVSVTDREGEPVEGAGVELEGTMTHPGMAPVLARAEPSGEGRYVVPGFEFTMGGDWVLTARVRLPDGDEAVRETEVQVYSRESPGGG